MTARALTLVSRSLLRLGRFNRYNDSLEKLSKAMAHYSDAAQTFAQATGHLMHSFSEFFEIQLQDCTSAR